MLFCPTSIALTVSSPVRRVSNAGWILSKYLDIKSKDLEKFDYVALGHIHERKIDGSNIVYPGSLLSIGFDELGEHGIVIRRFEKEWYRI